MVLLIGPLEMLYANGVRNARQNKQIIIKDFEKKWAVKKKICTLNSQHSAFDMEEDYEIIGEFDLWSEAMKCRNNAFESLPKDTFCAIDDPEATHYTISRGSEKQPFTKDTKFVKLWCVFNVDFLQHRIEQVEKLEADKEKLQKQLKHEQSKKGNKKTCKKTVNNIKALKRKIKNLNKRIFKMRHVMPPGTDLRNPQASFRSGPETSDRQPGIELKYVYHSENDFIPSGVEVGPNGVTRVILSNHLQGRMDPPSSDDEDENVDERDNQEQKCDLDLVD